MKEIELYKNNSYSGRFRNKGNWWFDPEFEYAFEIFDLDSVYPIPYFKKNELPESTCQGVSYFLKTIYSRIKGRPLNSVFEAGCASGWITKYLFESGVKITAIEGSKAGVEIARARTGLSDQEIIHHDLRRRIDLGKTFDLSFCTEVAEHIETPFSAILVETLIKHSDLIWFSTTGPQSEGDLNHPNEQPLKFWINLFEFYGFDCYRMPDIFSTMFLNRALLVFYDPKKYASVNWDQVFCANINLRF